MATYKIYHPQQVPRTDGGQFNCSDNYATTEQLEHYKSLCIGKAKITCEKMGWKYEDMLHEHNFTIIKGREKPTGRPIF